MFGKQHLYHYVTRRFAASCPRGELAVNYRKRSMHFTLFSKEFGEGKMCLFNNWWLKIFFLVFALAVPAYRRDSSVDSLDPSFHKLIFRYFNNSWKLWRKNR